MAFLINAHKDGIMTLTNQLQVHLPCSVPGPFLLYVLTKPFERFWFQNYFCIDSLLLLHVHTGYGQ